MSAAARAQGAQSPAADLEFVVFELGGGAGAIPMRVVERVVKADEVRLVPTSTAADGPQPSSPSAALRVDELFGIQSALTAWLVLTSPDPERWPNVLLGVGTCIGARVIREPLPLPPAFQARLPGLFTACFALETRDRGGDGRAVDQRRLHGLVMDPA
ncbi:MAG: hypothetical protein U0414_08195, partial [Polyangiaceae bacterium]